MSLKIRLLIGLVFAIMSLISYYGSSSINPVTGEKQRISLSVEEETALGMHSAPQMAAQFGGLSKNQQSVALVKKIGQQIVERSPAGKSPYKFEFHLLADQRTINAFALPGGQIFITEALLQLLRSPGELAGVLGHEIAHVVARHSAEHIAKQKLTQGLTGAAVMAADPSMQGAHMAQMVAGLINMRFGRKDELESDSLGLRWMAAAGYDPRALLGVMEVLEKSAGGGRQPEIFSTHPNPGNRAERIQAELKNVFPAGVPERLIK
ncbi:MAG: M48 family metallopeptidase [Deltaproteobacteria bacterium]|nr:M48 family metallopeptidase [Deltaproteobacteria bacterium]